MSRREKGEEFCRRVVLPVDAGPPTLPSTLAKKFVEKLNLSRKCGRFPYAGFEATYSRGRFAPRLSSQSWVDPIHPVEAPSFASESLRSLVLAL